MEIKPEDIKIEAVTLHGNWGMSNGVRVTVTHIPTGLEAVCNANASMHWAKEQAYRLLLKRLELNTDYYKQLELF